MTSTSCGANVYIEHTQYIMYTHSGLERWSRNTLMRVLISNSSPDPIYEQITRQIRAQILAGELPEGEPLPSIRKLAHELQISVITTKRAYEELDRDGLIDTVAGKGTFVAAQNPELLRERRLKSVEEKLGEAVDEARSLGVVRSKVEEMLDLLWEEE